MNQQSSGSIAKDDVMAIETIIVIIFTEIKLIIVLSQFPEYLIAEETLFLLSTKITLVIGI